MIQDANTPYCNAWSH